MSTHDKSKKKEFLSVRVSSEVKAKLEDIAEENERSLSWVVAKIISNHLEGKSPEQL